VSAAVLFDLAWKSGVVAAAVLAAAALLRSRPAAERVALLRLGVVVVLALPLLTTVVPALRIQAPALARLEPAPAAAPAVAPAPAPLPSIATAAPPRPAAAVASARAAPPHRITPLAMLGAVWAAGVGVLLLRLLGGVAALALWTRRADPVSDPAWRAALDRAVAGGRRPRLKVSSRIASPLSWSWPRGVILIDEETLSRPERADAVLTHEMGHIRHYDWLFLMLSHALVAMQWFNPFVWLLQKELARQSEHAADAWAVRRIGRTDYAGALVAMARSARPHAALGMAGPTASDLARRVAAILDASRGKGRPWSTAVAAVAFVGMAGPLAALEWTPEALPAPLRPATAPTSGAAASAAPTTAAAVVALLPQGLTAPSDASPTTPLTPDTLAVLIRQRDRGLEMFEAGARTLEAGADQISRRVHLVPEPEERAEMLEEANALRAEAASLRAQARDLAARDPATLKPMSEEEEREMAAELQGLLALSAQMGMDLPVNANIPVGVEAGAALPLPVPLVMPAAPPQAREGLAAGLREGAGRTRDQAARMDAEAARIEQDRSQPQEAADHAVNLRNDASALRQQADDLERQAADVMSD